MADIHARVTNKTGGVVTLLLDEDDERVEYFKKLVRREELEAVRFSKAPAKKAAADKGPVDKDPGDDTPADK